MQFFKRCGLGMGAWQIRYVSHVQICGRISFNDCRVGLGCFKAHAVKYNKTLAFGELALFAGAF